MRRFTSHLFYQGYPPVFLRRMWIEQDLEGRITEFSSLDDRIAEPSNTEFLEGLITMAPVSLEGVRLPDEYYLATFSNLNSVVRKSKTLVLDLECNSFSELTPRLKSVLPYLNEFTLIEILNALVVYPRLLTEKSTSISKGEMLALLNWKGLELQTGRFTPDWSVSEVIPF